MNSLFNKFFFHPVKLFQVLTFPLETSTSLNLNLEMNSDQKTIAVLECLATKMAPLSQKFYLYSSSFNEARKGVLVVHSFEFLSVFD